MVRGQLLYKNGDSYYGELKNGQLCGQGVYKFSNGSIYQGSFQNNEFNGRGKLNDQFNSIVILGQFKNGKPNGQGKVIYQDQSIYEGELKDGYRHGKGRYIYSLNCTENQYEGDFQGDMFCGSGILKFKNGDFYKGQFKNSVLNGLSQIKNNNIHFLGESKDGMPHGKGKMLYSSGQKYEGEFFEGYRKGYGIYTYKNGSIYKGRFQNDQMEGKGQIIFASKQIFKGQFHQNQPFDGQLYFQNLKIIGKIKNQQFEGFCQTMGPSFRLEGNYNQGMKHGIFSMIKRNPNGKQASYKGQFRNNKQNPYSVSYSQRL